MTFSERLRNAVPKSLRSFTARLLGIRELQERVRALEIELQKSTTKMEFVEPVLWNVARTRWREAAPDRKLTWGRELTGDAFVEKLAEYDAFDGDKSILEIGPGYGRLVKSLLARNAPFARYTGIDLSEENVAHLRQTFSDERLDFRCGDVEQVDLSGLGFHVVYSSLTLKHFYPTFEKALANIARAAEPGCLFCFDLREGTQRTFEPDLLAYIREYTQDELREMLDRTALELVRFDTVQHDRDHERLLVVARKA